MITRQFTQTPKSKQVLPVWLQQKKSTRRLLILEHHINPTILLQNMTLSVCRRSKLKTLTELNEFISLYYITKYFLLKRKQLFSYEFTFCRPWVYTPDHIRVIHSNTQPESDVSDVSVFLYLPYRDQICAPAVFSEIKSDLNKSL